MPIDRGVWAGKRVLLTGHTGFKGAWLSLWLQQLGARVTGVSSGPLPAPSLYALARVGEGLAAEAFLDIRDGAALRDAVVSAAPEVVLHLAAQPLVRRSLADPLATFEINAIGTANLLEAVRHAGSAVRAVLVVTSDKCYTNDDAGKPFVESDPLGGEDPYSASKACAELVVAAYRRSCFGGDEAPKLATARAGNVIGGGDWGEDRLLADAVRVATGLAQPPLKVRSPHAVRPWQHVLNPLSGYLLLTEALLRGPSAAKAWNFGPPAEELHTVEWVLERLRRLWKGAPRWERDGRAHPPEAHRLAIDSTAARRELAWTPPWDLHSALRELVLWHEAHRRQQDMRAFSIETIERFTDAARSMDAARSDRPD